MTLKEHWLQVCLAARMEDQRTVELVVSQLLQGNYNAEGLKELLQGLKQFYTVLIHKRQYALVLKYLQDAKVLLEKAVSEESCHGEYEALLNSLIFACCDRRIVELRPVLKHMSLQYVDKAHSGGQQSWSRECINLAARMARRGWEDEAHFLLRLVLKLAVRAERWDFLQNIMLQLSMHMELQARFEGFENAYRAFKDLQLVYLLLLDRIGKMAMPEGEKLRLLRMILRSIHDWVAMIARGLMLEEMEVYELWSKLLVDGKEIENPAALPMAEYRSLMRKKLLVQLELKYWNQCRPKSSRKQLKYLGELLEPDIIPASYRELLLKL